MLLTLLATITNYVYPVAPPWYVLENGFAPARLDAKSSPARLAAVDDHLGIQYFRSFYGRNANVFGALPSLHCAWPISVWISSTYVFPRAHWLFLLFALNTGFAAIYLCHHYIVDILLGLFYALLSKGFVDYLCTKLEARDERLNN